MQEVPVIKSFKKEDIPEPRLPIIDQLTIMQKFDSITSQLTQSQWDTFDTYEYTRNLNDEQKDGLFENAFRKSNSNPVLKEVLRPFFTTDFDMTLILFDSSLYIRSMCITQNLKIAQFICNNEILKQNYPEYTQAINNYTLSVLPTLSQKCNVVQIYCTEIVNNTLKHYKM
ncbi:hypothetical protein AKO1_002939, partial [Acrasis kona]